jgi:hypothetical protein
MLWQYVERFENWLSNYPEYMIGITGIYFSIFSNLIFSTIVERPDIIENLLNYLVIIIGIFLIIISGIAIYVANLSKKSVKKLEGEIYYLNSKLGHLEFEDDYHQDTVLEIVNFLTKYIGECTLSFNTQSKKVDRISLYVRSDEGFYPIARYSANPEYHTIRRVFYPPKQGAIYKSWIDGEYFKKYPDPISDSENYYAILEQEENIPKVEAEKIQMKSRLIFGYRIGENHDPVGVFVVESLNQNRFTKGDLEAYFKNTPEVKICVDIILKLDLPNPYIGEKWEEENNEMVGGNT